MKKCFYLVVCWFLLFTGTMYPVDLAAATTPETVSKLVVDRDVRDPDTRGRIPLLLIHGLWGTSPETFESIDGSGSAEKGYFYDFLEFFYNSSLKDQYKLYRFHYLSNELSVKEIARGLQEWLDDFILEDKIEDVSLVIIAHSMGGLVSRSYMEEHTHAVGSYGGQPGGERVRMLLTLATPHHGSPAANGQARDAGSEDWNALLGLADGVFWGTTTLTDPSRSDLRWDNYNNMDGYEAEEELNSWLWSLNESGNYTDKITCYYGGVESETYRLKELWDYLNVRGADYFSGLFLQGRFTGVLASSQDPTSFYKGPYSEAIPFDQQVQTCFVSVLLKKVYEVENDGLVPVDSGRLEQFPVNRLEKFDGFDHEDMKSDREGLLFSKIQEDLEAIARNTDSDIPSATGTLVTNDLWIGSVIETEEMGPMEAVWQLGGDANTPRGDRVIWGYFHASPDDVTWGSQNNPDLYVKIWFDAGGRVDVNFFHVSVPDIEVYSDYIYDGSVDEQSTTTLSTRYIRQFYENGQSNADEQDEGGNPPTGFSPSGNPTGYSSINDLRIGAMINTEERGPIEAIWQPGGEDRTDRGDEVVWGYFYASPSDVTWGSRDNPDLYVKIWFDAGGRIDVNFFHVSVPDIEVYSDHPGDGTYDQMGTTIMENRYIRHEYTRDIF